MQYLADRIGNGWDPADEHEHTVGEVLALDLLDDTRLLRRRSLTLSLTVLLSQSCTFFSALPLSRSLTKVRAFFSQRHAIGIRQSNGCF